jgi:hypothetical protein
MTEVAQKEVSRDENELLTAKQAASAAARYLVDLIELPTKPMLEEIELSDDRDNWLLTLSYPSPNSPYAVFGGNKDFKTFEVDRRTGEVLSMKIRLLK